MGTIIYVKRCAVPITKEQADVILYTLPDSPLAVEIEFSTRSPQRISCCPPWIKGSILKKAIEFWWATELEGICMPWKHGPPTSEMIACADFFGLPKPTADIVYSSTGNHDVRPISISQRSIDIIVGKGGVLAKMLDEAMNSIEKGNAMDCIWMKTSDQLAREALHYWCFRDRIPSKDCRPALHEAMKNMGLGLELT